MPKQSNHKSVARQWEMLHLVPSHGHGLSAAEICGKLAALGKPVSKRTVERDLEELSDFFEIDFDENFPRRWSWNPGHDAGIAGLTIAEAVSLRMVEDYLRANLPKALLGALEGRFRKARKFLKDFEDNNRTTWPERAASVPPVLPMLPPKVPDEILVTISPTMTSTAYKMARMPGPPTPKPSPRRPRRSARPNWKHRCSPSATSTPWRWSACGKCFQDALLDNRIAVMQYCGMISIPVSKRGTITLPPAMRRKLGIDAAEHPMMLVELRDGGIFLQPAEALPVRDIPEETLQGWIAEDEKDTGKFWRKAGKA